jgi:peptidoglycan/LPS O-acetylase OafA/YrhL
VLKPDSGRIDGLDSLRGLAAFIVLLHHCYYMLDSSKTGALSIVRLSPLRFFVAGHAAVIVFFLLSGFVLAVPYRSRQPHALGFIVRRMCRIYIPFASAVLLSAVLVMMIPAVYPIPGATELLELPRPDQLNFPFIAGHLLLLGRFQDISLDPPIWSLVHELRISLIFPLLLWFCRRWPGSTLGVTLAVGTIAAVRVLATGDADQGVVAVSKTVSGSLLITLRYLPLFAIGAYMAMEPRVLEVSRAASSTIKCLFVLAGIALLSGPSVPAWSDVVLAIGAILLILAFMSGWQPLLLRTSASRWLGRVSFSLYLVHVPIITACSLLLAHVIPVEAAVLIGAMLSLLGAQFAYSSVEANAHKLGKYLEGAIRTPNENRAAAASQYRLLQVSTRSPEDDEVPDVQERTRLRR